LVHAGKRNWEGGVWVCGRFFEIFLGADLFCVQVGRFWSRLGFFMNQVLKMLLDGENLSPEQMSEVLGIPFVEVEAELKDLEAKGILLGWRPIISPNADVENLVRAVIEVRITPERGGGFNRHAERISRFDEVESCYLMSGGYDLLVIARGQTLHQVAAFVSERLSTIEGVLSTSTHFLLRSYKEQGYLLEQEGRERSRPDITP
jgi:DNA-binding Lrp family transcriptional regulator